MSQNLRTIEALTVAIDQLTVARDEIQKRHDETVADLASAILNVRRARFVEAATSAGRAAATIIRALRR